MKPQDHVGPILLSDPASVAVISAIRELNEGVEVVDRGGYARVSAPVRCAVTRIAIEEHLGRGFKLPGDLERIMASFRGKLSITEESAEWVSEMIPSRR